MFLLSNEYWQIRQTSDKGRGVFATQRIPSGTVIGDYLGRVLSLSDFDPDSEQEMYLMAFGTSMYIYPDMKNPGIYLVNHSCQPNSWMYIYRGHTLFFALRDITPGEEITISYLLCPLEMSCTNGCVHECFCGSTFCRGTMHASLESYTAWHAYLKKEKRKTKMASYTVGAHLSPLVSYPISVSIDPTHKFLMSNTYGV